VARSLAMRSFHVRVDGRQPDVPVMDILIVAIDTPKAAT
jgi:hypothetical protein